MQLLRQIIIEVDRAAKAFDLHDIDTAALCCRKAVEGHVKMAPPEPSPNPAAKDAHSELLKAVHALETKEFTLAAVCLEKAVHGMARRIPAEMVTHFHRAAQALRDQNFGSVASCLRDGIHTVIGDRVVEPIKVTISRN